MYLFFTDEDKSFSTEQSPSGFFGKKAFTLGTDCLFLQGWEVAINTQERVMHKTQTKTRFLRASWDFRNSYQPQILYSIQLFTCFQWNNFIDTFINKSKYWGGSLVFNRNLYTVDALIFVVKK